MRVCTWRCSSAGFAGASSGGGFGRGAEPPSEENAGFAGVTDGGDFGGGCRGPLRQKGEDIGAACGQLKEPRFPKIVPA